TAQAPAVGPLPVESVRSDPETDTHVLDGVVKGRQGSLNPYQAASANFDVAFLTPVIIRGAQQAQASRGRGIRLAPTAIVATDFGEWSEYFDEVEPVLVVRVTPKMAEGFWTTIARGAAYTQGLRIPAIKHFKPGFLRLRAFCGDAEVTPIHPFTLTHQVSDTDAIREGLYVFDPQAFGPQCASVKLQMHSEKEPAKPDTLVVAPNVLDRIHDDFAYLGPQ
ncbi:MAG TPA: hypothetical protein VEU08_05395, partial [Vicinamibacterales bacterium]|nr:hypothetical protein [Vicinamibacterales bacterium]